MSSNVPRRLKILFVEHSIGMSGSTVSLCTLLNYLEPDQIDICVALSRPEQARYLAQHLRRPADILVLGPHAGFKPAFSASRRFQALQRRAPRVHRLAARATALLDLFVVTFPYARSLSRLARRYKADLIHQNNGFDLAAVIAARFARVPLIAYQRGNEWNSPLVRMLARHVPRYLANSRATRASLLSLGVPADRISVVYPPLDLDLFQPDRSPSLTRRDLGLGPGHRCFGIFGVLVPWKGHGVFLQAAQQVLRRLPNARAIIVGGPPSSGESYEAELRALARDLGITERVIFTGFRSDVASILPLLDVVVHASIEPEPFGRVIVEAMAMKRPVIAAGAGGPLEIVEDGRTGFLVPPGDVDALATRLIALLEDPDRARDIAECGHREVRDRFSAATHARLVSQAYEDVLHPTGARTQVEPGLCGTKER